jgi:hypothetical protein
LNKYKVFIYVIDRYINYTDDYITLASGKTEADISEGQITTIDGKLKVKVNGKIIDVTSYPKYFEVNGEKFSIFSGLTIGEDRYTSAMSVYQQGNTIGTLTLGFYTGDTFTKSHTISLKQGWNSFDLKFDSIPSNSYNFKVSTGKSSIKTGEE